MVRLRSFSFSYLSKITPKSKKSIPLSPHIVKKKSDRAEILHNMLMDDLQGQLNNGLAEVIFHRVS